MESADADTDSSIFRKLKFLNIKIMKIILKRIAKKNTYTIGRLYLVKSEERREKNSNADEGKGNQKAAEEKGNQVKPIVKRGNISPASTRRPVGQGGSHGPGQDDTQGCILVGENKYKGMVVDSRKWLKRLIDRITEARERDEMVWITIVWTEKH